ncbi:transcription factor atf21 [Fusarium heterosporum]|uniref:Transcription factor atf21 n=1 Tax=Fusarium heterosporum TaxID=42747 RepID=A0A8H5TE90_FUSHE|nr:transcription factor atf21 [Fusarium heterosporum]
MDGSAQNHGSHAQNLSGNFSMNGADDTNIDPLLNVTMGGSMPCNVSNPMGDQFLLGSTMWNPALNDPNNFYPSGVSSLAPKTFTNSPKSPTDTRSSPGTQSSEPLFGSTRTSSKSSIPSVNSLDIDAKPRRGRKSSKAQQPAVESAAKPPRQRRVSKEPSLKEEDDEDEDDAGPEGSEKRDKFLKRNRIAASKCRQKKKEWVSNLEDTRYSLEHENNALHKQYNGLVDELSTIKNQLMQHASCNDANIDQWLDNEAKKFVQRITSQSNPPALGQPHRDAGDLYSHRRSSSSKSAEFLLTQGIVANQHPVATTPRSTESEIIFDHMQINARKPRTRG